MELLDLTLLQYTACGSNLFYFAINFVWAFRCIKTPISDSLLGLELHSTILNWALYKLGLNIGKQIENLYKKCFL